MTAIKNLTEFKLAIRDAGRPLEKRLRPIYGARSQSKLAYMGDLMLLLAGVASLVFARMIHTHLPLFASMSKLVRNYTSDALLIAGCTLPFLAIGQTIFRLRDKMILNEIAKISLEDPNQRLLGLAGKPEKRDPSVCRFGEIKETVESGPFFEATEVKNRVIHYAVDFKKKNVAADDLQNLRFHLSSGANPTDADSLAVKTLSEYDHAQMIIQEGDQLICQNRGDHVAFLIRIENHRRKFILLSEPQSKNPYFKEKQLVKTSTTWQAGDQLVIGARISPAVLREVITEETTYDAEKYFYLYDIDKIVEWAQGKKIVLSSQEGNL